MPRSLNVFAELSTGLIQAFLLQLVRGHDWPPDGFVQVVEDGLEKAFRDVDVAPFLEDFLVDEFGDLAHAVVRGAIEFEGFAGGGVIIADVFEGHAYVNGLARELESFVQNVVVDLRGLD